MNKKIITTILTGIILVSNVSLTVHATEKKDIRENTVVSTNAKRMIVNGQIRDDGTKVYSTYTLSGRPYQNQLGGGRWILIDMAKSDAALKKGYRVVFIKAPEVSGYIQIGEVQIDASVIAEWGWEDYI